MTFGLGVGEQRGLGGIEDYNVVFCCCYCVGGGGGGAERVGEGGVVGKLSVFVVCFWVELSCFGLNLRGLGECR